MKRIRIIARLDIKGSNVVKGVHMEGLRIIGDPLSLAKKYNLQGADEILYIDTVASLYGRNNLLDIVERTVGAHIHIPVTVAGGIRSLNDIKKALRAGADKVAINTSATKNPPFITKASEMFGAQCIVGSIEAKRNKESWEVYIDNGREKTGLDAIKWAKKMVEFGVGEILITSIDKDGICKGFDHELIAKISSSVSVPVIAGGGAGDNKHILDCFQQTNCDAVAIGSILHYNKSTITSIKAVLPNDIYKFPMQHNAKIEMKEKKSKMVSIIDYGVGNIKSLMSACKAIGQKVKLISTKDDILNADLLILPGDGAFGYAMEQLKEKNLDKYIIEYCDLGKPLLGICLGMQLLFTQSKEFGDNKGLNLIEGRVKYFKGDTNFNVMQRLPHIGWNNLKFPSWKKNLCWNESIFDNVIGKPDVYFVHSLFVEANDPSQVIATAIYGEKEFCAVIKKDNIYGMQFHPEKSGTAGLKMLYNFCNQN